MNPNLFKSAEFYRRRYHNFATVLIIPLVCLLVFLFIFLLFAKKEVTVLSDGEISPIKVIDVIQSKSDYPISENNLTDNHAVKKGDVLIQYVNPAANTRQGGNNQNQNQSQNKQNKNQQQNNKNQKNGNQGQKNQNQNQNKKDQKNNNQSQQNKQGQKRKLINPKISRIRIKIKTNLKTNKMGIKTKITGIRIIKMIKSQPAKMVLSIPTPNMKVKT